MRKKNMEIKINKFLGNSVSKRILIFLFNNKNEKLNYSQQIAREINSSLSATMINVPLLNKIGLVKATKEGRINQVKLTKKGREIAKSLIKIEDLLNG